MKKAVIVFGANCSGKTTLVKYMAENLYGGYLHESGDMTYLKDGKTAIIGTGYIEGKKISGVDRLLRTKGMDKMALKAFANVDTVIAEGMMLKNFGLNITDFVFCGDAHLVVYLYTPLEEIHKRLLKRSGPGDNQELR